MESFPVIGISGPAGSGKDFVADWFVQTKDFVKIAFADPMKRFLREVFLCSHDVLWGATNLRSTPLTYSEDEWLDIIGRFTPLANTFVREVAEHNQVMAYMELMNWFGNMRLRHNEAGHITMREALQTLGTEWGRQKVDPLIWVKHLHEKVAPPVAQGAFFYEQYKGLYQIPASPPAKGIVIPDTRFLNEIQGNRYYGGCTARLRRLAFEQAGIKDVGIKNHLSETEMRELPDSDFDLVLELGEGADNVYPALEKLFEEKLWNRKASVTSGSEQESRSPTA